MENRYKLKQIFQNTEAISGSSACISGWVRTKRDAKGFSFIEVNDGTTMKNLQIIAEEKNIENYGEVKKLTTGSAIQVQGILVPSAGKEQALELSAQAIRIYDIAPETYPLQKKRHSLEFLRQLAHLRPRTNTHGAIFRLRSVISFAIHQFFQERGFHYIHTPIITASDCEGAGELFRVTAGSDPQMPKTLDDEFFGKRAYLTVSGQLNVEAFSLALSDVYTFGPTFRAENSNTSRHLSEFWMIEPEIAFADLKDDMDLAEAFLKFLIQAALRHCPEEMNFFNQFYDKTLIETLEQITNSDFKRLSYTDAIAHLEKSGMNFEYPVQWGANLQAEHERYLCEQVFRCPIILYDYPKEIKAFYMRLNDDNKTVAAMDVLFPKVGEIIGGSQREERLEVLTRRLLETGANPEDYEWYLDLRRYGSAPHAGFGLGLERILMFLTGITNIRDVIPYPRAPKQADF